MTSISLESMDMVGNLQKKTEKLSSVLLIFVLDYIVRDHFLKMINFIFNSIVFQRELT